MKKLQLILIYTMIFCLLSITVLLAIVKPAGLWIVPVLIVYAWAKLTLAVGRKE